MTPFRRSILFLSAVTAIGSIGIGFESGLFNGFIVAMIGSVTSSLVISLHSGERKLVH